MREFDPTASEYISSGYIEKSRKGGVLYDPVSLLSAGATIVGSAISADAAGDAADQQAASARASDATQRYFYDTTREDNAPFRDTGVAANNRLAYLMGLGGTGATAGAGQGSTVSRAAPGMAQNASTPAAGGYSSTAPTTFRPGESGNALWEQVLGDFNAQHQAQFGTGMNRDWNADADAQNVKKQLDAQYQALLAQQPEAQAAAQQAEATRAADPNYGSLMRNYTAADLASDPVLNADASYMTPMHDFGQEDLNRDLVYQNGLQFGLDNGNKAINRQAAAGGSTLSGATLKALTRFGNDYATTKTADAANRFTTNQNTKYGQRVDSANRYNNNQDRTYNKLAGLSGAGQQATNQVTAAGQNAANTISSNQTSLGNAQGASTIAQGNALANALNGGVAAWRGNQSGYGQSTGYQTGQGTMNQLAQYGVF